MPVHRRHVAGLSAALLAAALIAACSGAKDARQSTAPQTSATVPGGGATSEPLTPTPAPPDAKTGDRLRAEGEFRAAADVYAAIAARSNGEKQQAARLTQAQMLSRAGDAAATRSVLDAFFAADPGEGDAATER